MICAGYWKIMSTDGRALESANDIKTAPDNIALVFEGGQWVWPGIDEGYVRTVTLDGQNPINIETMSFKPLLYMVKSFFSDEECDHAINKANPHMIQSPVSLMDHDKGKAATQFRTSTSHFISPKNDPILKGVEARVKAITRTAIPHQEDVQVLRYFEGQRYGHHTDWWDIRHYADSRQVYDSTKNGYRNRFVTMFWYMNTVAEGGETSFPYAGGVRRGWDRSLRDGACTVGIQVKPQKGQAVFWYNLQPNGVGDEFSTHSACPPKGEGSIKWGGNIWVWNLPNPYFPK